jgi:hypothetical protein
MERTLELLKALSQNDFRGCFKGWNAHMEECVASNGNYSEGDRMLI